MNAFDYFFEKTHHLDKPFLVGNEELTFKDLYQKSLSLSRIIKDKIGINNNIIILSPNNAFFLVVYNAILKSGNICIPLDPMIEEENYNYIQDISKSTIVFTTSQVQKRLAISGIEILTPEIIPELNLIAGEPEENFDINRCAEIIFTSGSTGIPKGVMISHKNLIANTNSILEYLKLDENDRMLVVLPFYYCYGLSLLHTHLRVGGSLVFNNSFIFLGKVINDLVNYECTGFAGVPSHFQILLRKSDTFRKTKFPTLKYVTQAGGKLTTVFIDEFKQSFPDIDFIVMYGQTEATARLSYLPPVLYDEKKGSIGKGIPGVQLRVVNELEENVKPGETGEVVAQGENIMLGYYQDEENTSYTLRNNWLHTGDMGTVDEEGYIYLTARQKEIIKVGGKRISPKEIEAVILMLPEIIDCYIEGIEDDFLGEALKATITANFQGDVELFKEKVKQHCASHLVLHKIPHVYEFKEQINMSATGKKIKTV